MLAMEREPGLKPFPPLNSQGGRPRGNGLVKDAMIIAALFKAESAGKSVSAAAHHLAATETFKGMKPGSIRARYYKLKSPKTAEDARNKLRLAEFIWHCEKNL